MIQTPYGFPAGPWIGTQKVKRCSSSWCSCEGCRVQNGPDPHRTKDEQNKKLGGYIALLKVSATKPLASRRARKDPLQACEV